MNHTNVLSVLACALAVVGLSFTAEPVAGADAKKKATSSKSAPVEQAAISSGVLTQEEARLDCKRMAGRMQIRILELRGGGAKGQSSAAAQGMQSAVVPLFGGTRHGANAAGEAARDRAKLSAMNQILMARGCPYYDVDSELKMEQTARSPRLIRANQSASKKPKAKKSAPNKH